MPRRASRRKSTGERVAVRLITVALLLLLLPLPWRSVAASEAPGTAWRLDGRLEVSGEMLDPPGDTLWLAAGRPQILLERLLELMGLRSPSMATIGGGATRTPANAAESSLAAWAAATGQESIENLRVRISFPVGPVDFGRAAARMGLGESHGLAIVVALLRDSGHIDASGMRIAATGRIDEEGLVSRVGGIAPKARAAARGGADLLLVPVGQSSEATAELREGYSAMCILEVAAVRDLLALTLPDDCRRE